MYLEERVEQLEHLATDQGRQIETIAKGLAELTTDVRAIRQDMTEGFRRIDEKFRRIDERFDSIDKKFDSVDKKFDSIDKKFDSIDEKFARIDQEFAQIKGEFKRVDDRLDAMQQTQQLILKILTDRL